MFELRHRLTRRPPWLVAVALLMIASVPSAARSSSSACVQSAAGSGAAAELPELCGTTTISAPGSALVRVRLTESVRVDPDDERLTLFDVDTDARAAGFALVPEDEGSSNGYLVGGRIRSGSPADSTFLLGVHPVFGATSYAGTPAIGFFVSPVILEPGTYRLSMFTDGGPLRLALRLRGLTGSGEFAATTDNDAIVRFPDSGVPPQSPGTASAAASLATEGLTIGATLIESDALAGSQYVMCRRMAMPQGEHACTDQDPGTADDPGLTIYNDRLPAAAPTTRLLVHSTGKLPPIQIGLGFVNAVAGAVRERSFVAVWLPTG